MNEFTAFESAHTDTLMGCSVVLNNAEWTEFL